MTTIIAIEHEGGVTLGYDSQVSFGGHGADLEQPKVFANGEVIFGLSGDVLDGNILRFADLPALAPDDWDIDRWVTNLLIPAIAQSLHDRNVPTYTNGKIETGTHGLLVIRGRVYELSTDTSWVRRVDQTYAVGSGWAFAQGALSAGATVREALDIAAHHDKATGHRLTIKQSTELLNERQAA